MDPEDLALPPQPQEPFPSDCCGNGCTPCVFDIYQEELEMWQAECKRIKNGEQTSQSSPSTDEKDKNEEKIYELQKSHYTAFTISSITRETHDSLRVSFHLPKSKSLGLAVGQHIIIRDKNLSGTSITRQYTPVSPILSKGHFEFIFKIYPEGQMSSKIKSWTVGDRIEMRGPVGNFVYTLNKHQKLLVLCAGTGIAPMCQVIHSVLDNEEDETFIRLVYACKNYTEILARKELDEWKRFWNFSSVFVLSQEPQTPDYSYRYGDEIIRGHIDESLIHSELGESLKNTMILICGTCSFDSDMLDVARKLEVPSESVHRF